jgi:hypothetical protein
MLGFFYCFSGIRIIYLQLFTVILQSEKGNIFSLKSAFLLITHSTIVLTTVSSTASC